MKYFFLLLGLCLSQLAWAQKPLEPLQIAKHFVAPEPWPAMREYLCCEVAQQAKRLTLGQQIPPRTKRQYQLLQQGPSTAVVTVELRDSTSANDFYLHFAKDSAATWKLQAVRGLSMTNFGVQMLKIMEEMPAAEAAKYDQQHPNADRAFTMGNIRLWIGSDANIMAHFRRRRADFDKVLRLVQAKNYFPDSAAQADARENEKVANADPAVRALLESLYISRVTQRDLTREAGLQFIIGGLINNTVGLLYQPDANKVPEMSPTRIIVIKEIGQGWYLYKTT